MKKLLFTLVLLFSSVVGNAQTFKLGDINKDGKVTITDVMMVVDIVLNGYMPLELSSENVVVDYGSSATVNISSGYGPYDITCSDGNLVGVSLNGTLLSITGKAVGTAVVTVTDTATGYTKDINVTVNAEPLTFSKNTVEVTAGESAIVEVTSGSGNYSVMSSDPSVATATVSNGIVTVISVAGGTATITVTDTNSDQSATITVTVYFPLTLSASSLKLIIGDEETVNITSGNGSFTVVSSDTGVATAKLVESSVYVTAVGAGTAAVTVTDCLSGETATIEVQSFLTCPDDHHPHLINLGLPSGTKWACCNVDTDYPENQKPENYGGYYASGETETKTLYDAQSYQHYNGGFQILGSDIAGTEYDVAHVKWGGSWVIPSKEQQEELVENCTYEWTTMNGVKGGKFTSKINGCTIFLPAAGLRRGGGLYVDGSYGYYWLSTQNPMNSARAYSFIFSLNSAYWSVDDRYLGHTVRPVSR